ncbi:DgyrCDS1557 [Dimorphilus gyrociliatus]|nr:DgyrCDS1557 [Dimorphilus gyrociliatus]
MNASDDERNGAASLKPKPTIRCTGCASATDLRQIGRTQPAEKRESQDDTVVRRRPTKLNTSSNIRYSMNISENARLDFFVEKNVLEQVADGLPSASTCSLLETISLLDSPAVQNSNCSDCGQSAPSDTPAIAPSTPAKTVEEKEMARRCSVQERNERVLKWLDGMEESQS